MRRHEKDFILRNDEKYGDDFDKRLSEFADALKGSDLPAPVRIELSALMKTYAESFSGYMVGAVAELVGNKVGVVSGVINLESSGVEAADWRPRHDEHYHEV